MTKPASISSQKGFSVPYLIGMLALCSIVAGTSMRMYSGSAPSATRLLAAESARELAQSGQALATDLATLRLTHGAAIDPQISGGLLTSASGLWPAQPISSGSTQSTLWAMSAADALISAGEAWVAVAETNANVCDAYNQRNIRGAIAPVVIGAANEAGGVTYSIGNAASVNGGAPLLTFCDPVTNKVYYGLR